MIIVDTTVLVYAVGAEHPLRAPSRHVVTAITDGEIDATTTAGVIQEFAHVRARRYGRADAVRHAQLYVDLLPPLSPVGRDELRNGLRLFEQHSELTSFDAVLAAVALNRDAQLVSADRAFATVPGLRHADPAGPDFEQLLG